MFPVLVSVGPLVIKTMSLFSFLAFFATVFVFWRKAREEHYHEVQIFDVFLIATVVGFLFGRVGFIAVNWADFGFSLWNWLDLVGHAGSLHTAALVGATLSVRRSARDRKWDVFEVLDFWSIALTAGLFWKSVGYFLDGSGFGTETKLPWGMVFPGVFDRHHPLQLYAAVFYLLLFGYLTWADSRYRTFGWYRAGKKTAQTGYLTSIFLLSTGVFLVATQWIRPSLLVFNGVIVDWFVGIAIGLLGLILLITKSGRTIGFHRKSESLPPLDGLGIS